MVVSVWLTTRYHIDARRTWLATSILPASERLLWLQLINFLFKAVIIFSKFSSVGRRKPTWTPRYLTPSPSGIHLRPTSWPQVQVRSLLFAQMAADLL